MVPWELYECEDGEVTVISGPYRYWRRAAEIFADSRLFHKKYDHCLDRIEHREEYEAMLKTCLKSHKKRELFHEAQARKLAFSYLADLDEVLESPQHLARQFYEEIDHPIVGNHKYCGAPFKMSETSWQSSKAPILGEHNEVIYGEVLGYSAEEIHRLREGGLI
jgi:crotonobetainyl-CoA:carnitine CoA-transferase CaiB-like acyl-CoA transferase